MKPIKFDIFSMVGFCATNPLTFFVRVGPEEVLSAAGVLVAVALPVVGGKADLPVAGAHQLLAELALHGHAVLDSELVPEHLVQVSAVRVALPAYHLWLKVEN